MEPLTKSGALYNVALNCALHRQRKTCKNKFNDPICKSIYCKGQSSRKR